MRVAAVYDVHGNLPALDAVLADVARAEVDVIVVGGDLAWGPPPSATVERLMDLGDQARFVVGNADLAHVAAFDGRAPAADPVTPDAAGWIASTQRDFLAAMPPHVVLSIEGLGPTLFCHGTPRSEIERVTTATSDERLRGLLVGVEQPVVVCGHTHRQFDRVVDGWRVVNPGSVGLPFEGRTGAFWALLGPRVELRRSEYDLDTALTALRAAGMPDSFEKRLSFSLIEPADPDEVAEFFERKALDSAD
ncbi:MAG TPA: metallophosphoesterase family protein [Solirubrobacteraceae bacterium]|jgi:putative phosphoesterase